MAEIADYDKYKMKNIALIYTLESEMLHKFKELSSQLADNPGLKPIVDKYRAHLKIKKAEARAMHHYFQSLLISLYSLNPRPKSNKQKKGGGGNGDDGAFFLNKLKSDEGAMMHEIHKWSQELNKLKEF